MQRASCAWSKTGLLFALAAGFGLVCAAQSATDSNKTKAVERGRSFEVASVKPTVHPRKPNFSFDGPNRVIPSGRFSAAIPLAGLISFAYDVRLSGDTHKIAFAKTASWVEREIYDVEARAAADVTKDQMRLMVRDLLEKRFKLKVRFEDREIAVLAMTLDKPGKAGPQLRPHAMGPPCPERNNGELKLPASKAKGAPDANVFPAFCGDSAGQSSGVGHMKMGGRDNSMEGLAAAILQYGTWTDEISKPIVDRTGLQGSFDFTVEWSGHGPQMRSPDGVAVTEPEANGPSFVRALREQLGVKLVPARTTLHIPVIIHVERPSEN
jgi:uncharacterized protein (TIGR03435 family)